MIWISEMSPRKRERERETASSATAWKTRTIEVLSLALRAKRDPWVIRRNSIFELHSDKKANSALLRIFEYIHEIRAILVIYNTSISQKLDEIHQKNNLILMQNFQPRTTLSTTSFSERNSESIFRRVQRMDECRNNFCLSLRFVHVS